MTTLDQARDEAQPRVADFDLDVTEGRDWVFALRLLDGVGAPMDLSASAFSCQVWTDLPEQGGVLVATFTVTGDDDGWLEGTCATTNGTAGGVATRTTPRQCLWWCVDTTHDVQLWGPGGSTLRIWQEGTL